MIVLVKEIRDKTFKAKWLCSDSGRFALLACLVDVALQFTAGRFFLNPVFF